MSKRPFLECILTTVVNLFIDSTQLGYQSIMISYPSINSNVAQFLCGQLVGVDS